MDINSKIFNYWQVCHRMLEHFALDSNATSYNLTQVELNQGKLADPNNLPARALDSEQLVIVIPKLAADPQQNKLFLVAFYAIVTTTGEFKPYALQPLPWLLDTILEPSSNTKITLATREQAEQTYQFEPPPWLDEPEQLTWEAQLNYAAEYFAQATDPGWEQTLIAAGYKLLAEAAIVPVGTAEQIIAAIDDFDEQHEKLNPLWQRLFTYDLYEPPQPLIALKQEYVTTNAKLHTAHITERFKLSVAQRFTLMQALALKPNETFYVAACAGSGKSTVLHNLVATLWVNAAVSKREPPVVAKAEHTQHGNVLRNVTIFDCLPEAQYWLSKQQISNLASNQLDATIAEFLTKCELEFGVTVDSLPMAKILLSEQIAQVDADLQAGLSAVLAEKQICEQHELHYSPYGGIAQRAADLSTQLEQQEARYKHLQVLQSLWDRQIAEVPKTLHMLYQMLPGKKWHLAHFYKFFAEHFPEQNVAGLNIKAMTKRIAELLLQSDQKYRSLQDTYFQLESDLRQLEIAANRSHAWMLDNMGAVVDVMSGIEFMDQSLRYKLCTLVAHYWEVVLLQWHADSRSEGDRKDSKLWVDYLTCSNLASALPDKKLDYLLIETANKIPLTLVNEYLDATQRMIVIGENESTAAATYFSHTIDHQLLTAHGLIPTDEELEDLEYLGLTLSKGNMSTMFAKVADYRDEPYCLITNWDTALPIAECYRALMQVGGERGEVVSTNFLGCAEGKEFNYLPVRCASEPWVGSRKNPGEITTIVQWLKQYQQHTGKLKDTVAIYTPFYGQLIALRTELNANALGDVGVELLDFASGARMEIIIFSPVYTLEDRGALAFDSGTNSLGNLLRATKQQLLVVGDERIFDCKLHSPSGKVAKYLFANTGETLIPA